ncbi:MAG: 2Fe-2S iron-sulfur cluster-binding protein [Planctomycetota bacterium]|jgi:uncharacterized 2Fe-2S/4Fe-4S cluster protein (DUF4445 family)
MKEAKKKKYIVRFEPSGLKIEVPSGTILLEAAHKAGIYLTSICGGDGYCGKCKVFWPVRQKFFLTSMLLFLNHIPLIQARY